MFVPRYQRNHGPEPPSSVTSQRKRYWDWVAPLQASGEGPIRPRQGGDAARWPCSTVPIQRSRLHQRLNEWADIIPARFGGPRLIDAVAAKRFSC